VSQLMLAGRGVLRADTDLQWRGTRPEGES
jgi:hypothetical protein